MLFICLIISLLLFRELAKLRASAHERPGALGKSLIARLGLSTSILLQKKNITDQEYLQDPSVTEDPQTSDSRSARVVDETHSNSAQTQKVSTEVPVNLASISCISQKLLRFCSTSRFIVILCD